MGARRDPLRRRLRRGLYERRAGDGREGSRKCRERSARPTGCRVCDRGAIPAYVRLTFCDRRQAQVGRYAQTQATAAARPRSQSPAIAIRLATTNGSALAQHVDHDRPKLWTSTTGHAVEHNRYRISKNQLTVDAAPGSTPGGALHLRLLAAPNSRRVKNSPSAARPTVSRTVAPKMARARMVPRTDYANSPRTCLRLGLFMGGLTSCRG